ncbi:MAG: thioredoxin family protein, partial [Candidatus Daviesbacteria bacterium]|nr:thioredoxin family protein [Candidatus Daviesbacteria bacterium]
MVTKLVSCNNESIKKAVNKYDKLALIYTDKRCPICPEYLKLVKKSIKKTDVLLVEVELGNGKDSCEATADKYEVTGTPTLLYFEDGKLRKRISPTGDNKKDK